MVALDQLKRTFFDECSELLQQIEAGLTDIREGQSTDDTINAVFRGVHSVKGGAGMFGFDALVEFAHVFETVLDCIRRGSLAALFGCASAAGGLGAAVFASISATTHPFVEIT